MANSPVERFLIRTVGGPHPGTRVTGDPGFELTWPLPETLPDEDGRYVKISESQLPPQDPSSHVMRGAEYKWKPWTEYMAEMGMVFADEDEEECQQ